MPHAVWESYVEDGLGDCRGTCVEVEGGWIFGVQRHDEATSRPARVGVRDEARLPEALDALLPRPA